MLDITAIGPLGLRLNVPSGFESLLEPITLYSRLLYLPQPRFCVARTPATAVWMSPEFSDAWLGLVCCRHLLAVCTQQQQLCWQETTLVPEHVSNT